MLNNDDYDFGAYTCAITHLPCCECSLFCEHRQFTIWEKFYDGWFEYYYNTTTGDNYCPKCGQKLDWSKK